jgi:DNA modification methylase
MVHSFDKRDSFKDEVVRRSRGRRTSLSDAAAARAFRTPRNDILPKLQVITRSIDDLHHPNRAIRQRTQAQVERNKGSIAAFGVVLPILIKSDGTIIKGGTRVEAARQLGITELPCIAIDHLTDVEVRALRIAMGRIPEQGEWDVEALSLEFKELILLDAPLEITGFSMPEIEALIIEDEPNIEVDGAAEPNDVGPPITKAGDAWRLGRHRIVCGDARDPAVYAALMGDEHAQLVLTDVPFNVPIAGHVTSGEHREFAMAAGEMSRDEFAEFNTGWMTPSIDRLVKGGLLATFIDWRSVELILQTGRSLGLDLLNLIVWAKTNGGMGSLWRSQHELLPVFKKPGAPHVNNVELGKFGRWRTNLWNYPGASSLGSDARDGLADHPTVIPVALLEDALLDITNRDDIVLEPFAGSGSTLIACEATGRRCRAIEIDPLYVDLVVRRWQALSGKAAMHEDTGAAFGETVADPSAVLLLTAPEGETDHGD